MDKHNWLVDHGGYTCGTAKRADPRTEFNCSGCNAIVHGDEITIKAFGPAGHRWTDEDEAAFDAELDRVWHEKLRPMAELVGLVEEADGQA